MVMEHLPPAPSPSQWPWSDFSSSASGVGSPDSAPGCVALLGQALNKAANDKARAPNANGWFGAFFIGSRVARVGASAVRSWKQQQIIGRFHSPCALRDEFPL